MCWYAPKCSMQTRCGFAGKWALAVTDSSGNVTTTTNAADSESADPNREAD